jgi:uncharacterized membrane protein YdjX (TVP38/TMEM64 family)
MNPLSGLALRIAELGPWAPALFILTYIVATVAFIPGSVLSLAAGAIFGLWRGVALVFAGAVIGSSVAFALARGLLRHRVEGWAARDPRLAAVSQAVAGEGLLVVLLLRLSPVIPYNVLNYALGASRVRFRDFLIGSIGMLPGTLLYTYSGKLIGDVALVVSGASPPRGAAYYALLAVGLAATVAVTIVLTRKARAAFEGRTEK